MTRIYEAKRRLLEEALIRAALNYLQYTGGYGVTLPLLHGNQTLRVTVIGASGTQPPIHGEEAVAG